MPVRGPYVVGLKVTATVQVPSAGTEAPQVLVTLKSPVMLSVGTLTAPLALLVTVKDCVAVWPTSSEPKLSALREKTRSGMPVPLRLETRVEPFEPTVRVPVRAPTAVGLK